MITWISANLATIVISALLLIAFAFALRKIVRDQKSGGCAGCPDSKHCSTACGCEDYPHLKELGKK